MSGCKRLEEVIGRGKENALSNECLQDMLHQTRRQVSKTVHDARQSGMLISSTNQGYFIAESDEEIVESYDRLYSMAVSILGSLKTMRREIKKRNLYQYTKEARIRQKGKR